MIEIEPGDFRRLVYDKAADVYRDLPWRNTRDPYAIMVSEFMLQQTQVSRVKPKFMEWMDRFPDPASLASASVEEVLGFWSGLGYNRRALALVSACALVVEKHEGIIPSSEEVLHSLPGIGPYTARAILAFAYDIPTVFLETNIRTVILRHYFPDDAQVRDRELESVAGRILDIEHPGAWYTALMDYGAELKRVEGNHSKRGAAYKPQSPFRTSRRRVRGLLLKKALEAGVLTLDEFTNSQPFSSGLVEECARALASEGFLSYDGTYIRISGRR